MKKMDRRMETFIISLAYGMWIVFGTDLSTYECMVVVVLFVIAMSVLNMMDMMEEDRKSMSRRSE